VANTVDLPAELEPARDQIVAILLRAAGRVEIKDADARRTVRPREAVLNSPEFQGLWERIKHRTTYRVHFDNELLIRRAIQALRDMPPVAQTRLHWSKA